MSRTVSARISKETHDKLRERCNKVGCSMNDFIEACIEFILNNYSEFDFGDEEIIKNDIDKEIPKSEVVRIID